VRASAVEFSMTFPHGLLLELSIMAPLQSPGTGEDHEHRSEGSYGKRTSAQDEGQR